MSIRTIKDPTFNIYAKGGNVENKNRPIDKEQLMKLAKDEADIMFDLENDIIQQLKSDGGVVESWTLNNPFINKVGFGDLSYEDDGLSEISLGITYDWATYSDSDQAGVVFDRATLPSDPSIV